MKNDVIGRIVATDSTPTTMDKFVFYTKSTHKLNALDVVKVKHLDGSYTFGTIENISHITDAPNFLAHYISNDFGSLDVMEATERIGMNYVEANVSYNTKNLYTPVISNSEVSISSIEEIMFALGLDNVENPLSCGYIKMYENTENEVSIPVNLNSKFMIGPEGAHLNISGISGLASKTSYAMFLIKSIQEQHLKKQEDDEENIAFIVFNVKAKDLLAIHTPNDFDGDEKEKEETINEYKMMGLSSDPLKNVKYFIPYNQDGSARNTFLSSELIDEYIAEKKLKKYKYTYEEDKEYIEMMFTDIDDQAHTMEAILGKIVDDDDPDFSDVNTWKEFKDVIAKNTRRGGNNKNEGVPVASWRKFKRHITNATKHQMFANNTIAENSECRIVEEIKGIKKNEIFVVDIAKLSDAEQSFVFGSVIHTINALKSGDYDEKGGKPPKIVIFVDELNKYASTEAGDKSPLLKEILNITERGRSLGVVLFAAEQFRGAIHKRVYGNCATHAYGRTNAADIDSTSYKGFPSTFKSMITRFQQGEYLLQNPIFRSLLRIKFPKPLYKQFKN